MRSLEREVKTAGIRRKLKALPDDLDATYKDIMDRINDMAEEERKVARNALSWIIFSARPLEIRELQHALAISPQNTDLNNGEADDTDSADEEFDEEEIVDEEDILSFCCGLVIIDKGKVRLVHYTAQSYFDKVAGEMFGGYHETIVQACASYLSLKILEQPDDQERGISYADDLYDDDSDDDCGLSHDMTSLWRRPDPFRPSELPVIQPPKRLTYYTKLRRFPFVEYAAAHIGHHIQFLACKGPDSKTLQLVHTLLSQRAKRNFLARVLYEIRSKKDTREERAAGASLHVKFGLSFLWKEYQPPRPKVDPATEAKQLPGSMDLFPIVDIPKPDASKARKDLSEEDKIKAMLEEIIEMVEFEELMEKEREYDSDDMDIMDNTDDTDVMENTDDMDNMSDTDDWDDRSVSNDGRSIHNHHSESFASWRNRQLMHSAPLTTTKSPETTPLHLATFLGSSVLVELYVKDPDFINAKDPWLRTPLAIAIQEDHFQIAELLLEHGASVDIESNEALAMILHSARNGNSDFICKMISGQPKDIPRPLALNLCLLQAALTGDSSKIKAMMANEETKRDHANSHFYFTALFIAIEFNQIGVVQALVDGGININVCGNQRATPLHRAAARKNVPIVKVLLGSATPPDLDIKDSNGETAWGANADPNHQEGNSSLS